MKKKQLLGNPPLNTIQLLGNRSYFDVETIVRNRMHSASQFMQRLELETVLTGHQGCVNRLEWSANGRLLASVSDDTHIMIWDAFRHRRLTDLQTIHYGNIFAVKFMPNSGDSRVATGAADCKVHVCDVERGGSSPVWSCSCHKSRVKSLATCPDNPNILWTSSEDGSVLQFDLREQHDCLKSEEILLLSLNNPMDSSTEIKSIAINPRRPEMLAVGASDVYARVYDRRMLSLAKNHALAQKKGNGKIAKNAVKYYAPGQFAKNNNDRLDIYKTITHVAFSPSGTELLVNMGAEQIYLYDLYDDRQPVFSHNPPPSKIHGHPLHTSSAAAPSKAPTVEAIKRDGNRLLTAEKFLQAINKYTEAIRLMPTNPVLYLNRATALMRRNWYGDVYAALRDCQTAVGLDPDYIKAHFRLARALLQLGYVCEANAALDCLVEQFPDYAQHQGVSMLRKDINSTPDIEFKDPILLTEKEAYWRHYALDYAERFVGHCNTTTDIKEASFFGNDGNYIIAGSDDGNFFIWERKTNVITNIFKGDDSIVNCVQPHPSVCLLATSGIDKVIRLWSPQREHSSLDVSSFDGPVQRNQQRMEQDPIDMTAERCTTS